MSGLSEQDLIQLDTLIYLNGISNETTVEKVIEKLSKNNYRALNNSRLPDGSLPCKMDETEWHTFLDQVKNNKNIAGYTITNYSDENVTPGKTDFSNAGRTGFRAMTVSKGDDRAAIFRGTANDYQWDDNAMGGYLSDTLSQKQALDYINGLPSNFKNLTVSGHSKGGNLSQYVALLSDKVTKCVSYDGQGFSEAFFDKYGSDPNFIARQGNITSIRQAGDPVGGILFPAALEANTKFFSNNTPFKDLYDFVDKKLGPFIYHKPNEAKPERFDSEGNMIANAEPTPFVKGINAFSQNASRLPMDIAHNMMHSLIGLMHQDWDASEMSDEQILAEMESQLAAEKAAATQAAVDAAMERGYAALDGVAPEQISYVVHGAKIYCEFGSRWGRLIVPKSHGVYLRQKAQLNKKDSKPLINVQSMGVCSAGVQKMLEDEEQKSEKKGFWKTVMIIIFGDKDKKKKEREELVENAVCECIPEIVMDWQKTKEDVFVEGEEALLNISFLVCIKGGAVIRIFDDGQFDS